jgi:hypothetical protein
MFEKTERAIINGEFEDPGNTGHTRHRTKTNTYLMIEKSSEYEPRYILLVNIVLTFMTIVKGSNSGNVER